MDPPERSFGRLSHPRSPRVWPTRPGLAAGMRFVFRVPVAERFLLGSSIGQRVSQLLQLGCLPLTAFKLRRPLVLSSRRSACSSLSCWELSLRDHSAAQRPAPSESTDCVDPADFRGPSAR